MIRAITLLYDDGCSDCGRHRRWIEREPAYVELSFLAWRECDAPGLRALPWRGEQLVAVSDDGRVWAGRHAFAICSWALRAYRLRPGRFARIALHAPCADRACAMMPAPRGPYR